MSKSRKGGKQKTAIADRVDRHELYEEAVQSVDWEVDFIHETFNTIRKRKPLTLREDFCGTANAACEWVSRGRGHHAIGVDIDADVLAWGRDHHVAALPAAARERIELLQADVLKVKTPPVDVVAAMNFSYWTFKDRSTLRSYFECVYRALVDDGIFFLDSFGGYEACQEMRERTNHGKFTYIWDQAAYDPVTGDMTCHIHFKFKDGSQLRRAFTYEWRLWTLPELRELLGEAGFSKVTIYWEGTDEKTGEGTGDFHAVEHGEADPAWIAYLVAER